MMDARADNPRVFIWTLLRVNLMLLWINQILVFALLLRLVFVGKIC